jgi:hypothetical protein
MSITRAIGAGRESVSISTRRLAHARYRVTLRPTDNAHNVGRTAKGTFRIS